ncbi:Type IV fimbrial biogenesis protein PilV [Rubrivivax sp. A210]|uniref:type IV pilus modification PilV family protein n=1 Tax=Rubrivivax sp. A210 TaxID=2772301 RepID=UPI00191952AD|nr:type IV pilus modification protein PilV [Rubrivivax sp. A210]CAD5371841.1 Type IV fimbrial biogenesis protein PilV [Rubrivivax sp. A210]
MKRLPAAPARRRAARGTVLLEVLIAVLLCVFGLLGFAAMQARATGAAFEALQRSQALVLAEDMAQRMALNRAQAANYPREALIGSGPVEDCAGLAGAALDLCQWGNLIRGSTEQSGTATVGSMLAGRGCIRRAAGSTDRYVITVAWLGITATGAPAAPCGRGDEAFPDDSLRRAVSTTVCVARLRDVAASAPATRC